MKKNINLRNRILSTVMAFAAATALSAAFTSCSKDSAKSSSKAPSIAVYVPGIMADSPIYAHLAQGVQAAADEYNKTAPEGKKAKVTVLEAGTNQAEWATKLLALTATQSYDVIISSNPSLPEIAQDISAQFPEQKYIFLDGAWEGNQSMACISYNQKEQSFLTGYIAGLTTKTHKVGLVAAQEYPVMNNVLYPYFAAGAKYADKNNEAEFRVVGNWYDASKGAEITDALVADGADVILPICGGASQGVISSAAEHNIHVVWFDENAFDKAPGVIISCCLVNQDVAAKEITLDYLNGNTEWGTTKVVGLQEGYVEFVQDDPLYQQYNSAEIRTKLAKLVEDLKTGKLKVPELN